MHNQWQLIKLHLVHLDKVEDKFKQQSINLKADMNRALLQAQLQQQGFTQAQQASAIAQQQQAGLASLQPSLSQSGIQQLGAAGTSNLAYQQAILDAQAQGNQLSAYEPYNRLQFLSATTGGLLAGQPQAYIDPSNIVIKHLLVH
jgi:hypothetical protein